MAYAAVASLLQTVDLLLDHHQPSISPQFETQIISIHQHTRSLHSFIEGSSDRVDCWEERIREVTNRAEDIIELLLSDSLLKSTLGSPKSELEKGKYEVCYSYDELEKVMVEIETIANRVKGGRRFEAADGSDEELMEIVSRLRGGSSSLERIAICGIGGMGKTTLAINAYYHPLIVEHFDVRMWSTVTGEYIRVRVIEDLLLSMKEKVSRSNSEDQLIESLLHNLGRKRYLIVLDDVWSFEVLERLSITLPDYGNGSRIILTTRSFGLAESAHHIHKMRLLDEDKTWNLLREKIFKGDPCPFQLESIGKMIAGTCGGNPLSIEVVSGILASDRTKAAWEDVSVNMKIASGTLASNRTEAARKNVWVKMMMIASKEGDRVDEILDLSYIYLPHHLRPCLLYLGLFPEDRVIHVSTLIKLWVGEGFLNESRYKSLEEAGEEYVEDLVRRSLVSINRRKSNGRIKSVRVHDLVRDLCLRQARRDNFNIDFPTLEFPSIEIIKSSRRLSNLIYCSNFLRGVYGSTIRTIVLHLEYGELYLRCWMGNVRLLRILSLSNVYKYHLSDEVFELFHLRYLAILRNPSIPEAISKLENLQTLIIHHVNKGGVFDKLPEGIWRMQQLRHLRIFSIKFPNKRESTGTQENLQTLSQVEDFVCSRENIKMFPNLKTLALLYTMELRDVVEDYELHNLKYLHKLEILKVKMDCSFLEEHKMSCVFPSTLKKLSLRGLQLSWEDMNIVASLPNLEVLKLRNHACAGYTWETSEGGFSRLFFLQIEESSLENWIIKSSHFPRLAWLVLHSCLSLLEVPYEMVEVPTLRLIELDDTNHSLLRSAERIQKDRHSLGHDPLQIHAV